MSDNVIYPQFGFDPNTPREPEEKHIHAVVRATAGLPNEDMRSFEVRYKKLDHVAAWAALVAYIASKHKSGALHAVVLNIMNTCKRLPHTRRGGAYVFSFEKYEFTVNMMEL